jgi:hypothetical protein
MSPSNKSGLYSGSLSNRTFPNDKKGIGFFYFGAIVKREFIYTYELINQSIYLLGWPILKKLLKKKEEEKWCWLDVSFSLI